jgi:hypothetical protein
MPRKLHLRRVGYIRRFALLWREHERGLREADLECERLHHLLVKPAPVGDDRELIARERAIGEDVDDHVAERRHSATLSLAQTGIRSRGLLSCEVP